MVVTKDAHGSSLKIQAPGLESGLCNPARGENAQYLHVGEDEHVALYRAHPRNHTFRACTHLRQRFPSGATVLKQIPAWAPGPNIGRAPALVRAKVPFHQIGIGVHALRESRQFASPARTLERTREHPGERQAAQPRA